MREIRTFVRFGSIVEELTASRPLRAGRSAECELVLDDDLASREHCRLELVGDAVFVVDLGSRNGILVNGLAVDGREELHHADQVTVGRSSLMILRQAHEPRSAQPPSERQPRTTSSSTDLTGTGSIFEILSGAARSALESNDLTGADSSARNLFITMRGHVARETHPPARFYEQATELALDLADRTGEPGWLERLLELFTLSRAQLAPDVAERVVSLAERLGAPRALDAYLAAARAHGGADEPSARILERVR